MIDLQEHFYRNLKLSAWRTEPFESVSEQRRAQNSAEYKQSPEFREAVEDKISISPIGPMVTVGAIENREAVMTGDISDAEKAAQAATHTDAQAGLVEILGPQAGAPQPAVRQKAPKPHSHMIEGDSGPGLTDNAPSGFAPHLRINGRVVSG